MSIKISENDKERIRNGELACVLMKKEEEKEE